MANFLTILRLPFGFLMCLSTAWSWSFMFWTSLVVTTLTDALDGYLARLNSKGSDLGKVLDHTTDKFIILGMSYTLTHYRDLPYWVFVFVLLKEIMGTTGALISKFMKGQFPTSNLFGKLGGFLSIVSAVAFFYWWEIRWPLLYATLTFMSLSLLVGTLQFLKGIR